MQADQTHLAQVRALRKPAKTQSKAGRPKKTYLIDASSPASQAASLRWLPQRIPDSERPNGYMVVLSVAMALVLLGSTVSVWWRFGLSGTRQSGYNLPEAPAYQQADAWALQQCEYLWQGLAESVAEQDSARVQAFARDLLKFGCRP